MLSQKAKYALKALAYLAKHGTDGPILMSKIATEGNMYGAYEVHNHSNPRGIKRIFIHKDDYLIIQTEDDDFIDYRLQWSTKEDAIYLTDYDNQTLKVPFRWHNTDSLEFIVNNNPIICTPIDIEKLPLRQKLFHWMVDTQ